MPCFVPGRRAIDIITPMGDLRLVVMYSLLIMRKTCRVLTAPMDILAYPFLDLNFAKGMHNIVNAFVYWIVNMPLITVQRCRVVTKSTDTTGSAVEFEDWMKFLMCTPDATPGFNYLIAGVRRWGQLLDNWLNAVWLVLLGALGLPIPSCAPIPLTMRAVVEKHLFGGNETRVVGLTSGAYAITDGLSVEYTFFMGRVTQVFAPFVWEAEIDIKHGVAAVMYDTADDTVDASTGQQTMSMMGCRCLDVRDPLGYDFMDGIPTTRMEIQCALLRYDPGSVGLDGNARNITSPYYVPVAFSVPASALYLRCATTKITVDSARFPLWRLGQYEEAGRGKSYYDPMDGEYTRADGVDGPEEVDAVLWVVPACDAKNIAPSCQKALSDSGCYPYCMAARKRGGRNNGLMLFSGTDWDNNIQLMDHDCTGKMVVERASNVVEFVGNRSSPAYYTYKGLSYSNLDMVDGQFVFSQSWDPKIQECTYNPTTTSRVQRGTSVTQGADLERFTAILGVEQPFVVAGETSLTLVREVVDNYVSYVIRVKRLYGQQGTGFVSMVLVNSALEATGPCTTQSDCGTSAGYEASIRSAAATIPYSVFSDPSIHNPAAMTKWGVIYATNPSFAMFSQHFKRCFGGVTDVEFMLTSSAGPIRLWRVNAFAYDDPGGVRAVQTGGVVEIPDGFKWSNTDGDDICGLVFNVRVTSMEYLNDQNVAVQVLRASSSHFNPITNTFENAGLMGSD
ncbi:hypothetical protein T484DRAFT_1757998, partial [Baffinella frigidus]